MTPRNKAMLRHFASLVMKWILTLRSNTVIDQPTGLFNCLRLEEGIRQALVRHDDSVLVVAGMVSPAFLNDMIRVLGYSFADQDWLRLVVSAADERGPAVPAGPSTNPGWMPPSSAPSHCSAHSAKRCVCATS
jgi:hypothetical protein